MAGSKEDTQMVSGLFASFAWAFSARASYLRDQRLAFCIFAVGQTAAGVAAYFADGFVLISVVIAAVSPVFLYLITIWSRNRRRLADPLVGAKFVRIGYLRKMKRESIKIKRCQDMPDEAFADPSKAQYLIVLSHRWLDRWTCDMPSKDYTHGLRLETLVERLDLRFPCGLPSRDKGILKFLQDMQGPSASPAKTF